MKQLILGLVLALASTLAHALPAMCAANAGGGNIVLTSVPASDEGWYIVISASSTGQTLFGQWSFVGQRTIMIIWSDGRATTGDASRFSQCVL